MFKDNLFIFYLFCVGLVILGGCIGGDGSHHKDHDHDKDNNYDLLIAEVFDNRPLEEKFESVKLTMSYEEVRSIMGIPKGVKLRAVDPGNGFTLEWWYDLREEVDNSVPLGKLTEKYPVIIFGLDMVIRKEYGRPKDKPWEDQ